MNTNGNDSDPGWIVSQVPCENLAHNASHSYK
jgi:hypothetical protein